MKKITFGTPEKFVPSKFCDCLNYVETDVKYDVSAINFRVSARGCVLELPCVAGENIFGLGLQLKAFNLTGGKYTVRVNSDPVAATGDSHAPVPFFVSTAGYGIYVDTARYASFYFGKKKPGVTIDAGDNQLKLSVEELYARSVTLTDAYNIIEIPVAQGVDIYIIEGNTITDIVAQYNMLSGGGCEVPEWALGMFYRCCGKYTQNEVLAISKYFKESKIPCDILGLEPGWHTHAYSCSYVWDPVRYPDPKAMLTELNDNGYHVSLWEHAYVHPSSPIYNDLLPYSGSYAVWGGLIPDFTSEAARSIFADYHRREVMHGTVDGFKIDECDDSDYKPDAWSFPLCTEFPSGIDGEQYHSLFGTLYMKTMLSALDGKPTLSESRNAGALCSSYPFVIYSDLYDHRDFVRGLATAGFSGLLWTPEVRDAVSRDDFIQRMCAVVFSPQCLINAWYCERVPWAELDCEEEVRELAALRESLKPMLMRAFKKYKETGIPPVRALVSDYTDDEETYNIDDEYIFCDELIVAPIISGDSSRKVYLPRGRWTNYFTGEYVECGWHEVSSKSVPVYKKAD